MAKSMLATNKKEKKKDPSKTAGIAYSYGFL
jgi:hypothetical protein